MTAKTARAAERRRFARCPLEFMLDKTVRGVPGASVLIQLCRIRRAAPFARSGIVVYLYGMEKEQETCHLISLDRLTPVNDAARVALAEVMLQGDP